jgi:hypothetical protein
MKKVDLREYYSSPKDRARDRTVAIFEKVTAIDWMQIPDLCRAFYQEFGATLLVQPMGSPKSLEVCLQLRHTETGLDEAEDFVDNLLVGAKRTIHQRLGT